MITDTERINIHTLTVEKPLIKKAFPLESGLELTDDAWSSLILPEQPVTIPEYYFHYASLKILDFERSKTLMPSVPTDDEIKYFLEHEEDPLSLLGDVSILFPDLARPLIEQKYWRHFHYQFTKAVRNNYEDESLEIAANIKLMDPKRIEEGFLDLGDEYFIEMLKHINLRENKDKYYPYLRSLGFFKFIFPGQEEAAFNESDWNELEKEISEISDNNYLPWYLRSIKLGLADKIQVTADGLKVVVSNKHIWPKSCPEEHFALPEVRRY